MRNAVETEGIHVLSGIDIAVDFGLIPFRCQSLNMLAQFCLVARSSAKQVFEVEFNETIGSILFEKQSAIGV